MGGFRLWKKSFPLTRVKKKGEFGGAQRCLDRFSPEPRAKIS
jgi:hypothetical protein